MEEAQHRLEFSILPYRKGWEAGKAAAGRTNKKPQGHKNPAPSQEAEPKKTTSSQKAKPKKPPSEPTQEPQPVNGDTAVETTKSDTQPGDIIRFGRYSWRVLKVEKMRGKGKGAKALVLKEAVMENRKFHENWFVTSVTGMTWERCSLRRYLNADFLNTFSNKDQSRILETHVVTPDNPHRNILSMISPGGGRGGNDTTDKIFLLSIDEVMEYLEYSKQAQGKKRGTSASWWLRSAGTVGSFIAYVHDNDTQISVEGAAADYAGIGVRPAMWVRL